MATQVIAQRHRFHPYQPGGGTAAGISGNDYAVLATDTRMAALGAYAISCRVVPRAIPLSSKCVLACTGMQADFCNLFKVLKSRVEVYKQDHGREMHIGSIAQMLSTILYQKRFFPYFAETVLAGVDQDGKGKVYGFDYVGSFDVVASTCCGSGRQIVQPVLDNQLNEETRGVVRADSDGVSETVALLKDAFSSGGERDIYTGDAVDIYVITKDGIETERFELKAD